MRALAGPVSITLTIGDHVVTTTGIGNPLWRPGGRAVIRKNHNRFPDTAATGVDLVAANLPPEMVEALRDPDATIDLDIVPLDTRPDGRGTIVLAMLADDSQSAAELAAADFVVCEDPETLDQVRHALARPVYDQKHPLVVNPGEAQQSRTGTNPERTPYPQTGASPDGIQRPRTDVGPDGTPHPRVVTGPEAVAQALAGHRVLVAATRAAPGASVLDALNQPTRVAVEWFGMPTELAAAAGCPVPGMTVLASSYNEAVEALRVAPKVAFTGPPDKVVQLLERVESATIASPVTAEGTVVWAPSAEHLAAGWTTRRAQVSCCLVGAGSATLVAELVRGLLDAGLPPSAVAKAAATLPGMSRNSAYKLVHG
ncbi:hypothetical protein GCM10029964_023410 [Kibdelosporangium lantanae]